MNFTPATQLYKYKLKHKIGGGHFGQVWLAHDLTLMADVAVKILDEKMAPAAANLREAQVGNRLNHQNVVKVHYADVINHNNTQFVLIAMDHQPNGSILSLVNSGNFVVVSRAIPVIIDVLRGLEYLHEQHLFHNDIKPSNILIGSRHESLLTDYGISCLSPNLTPVAASNSYILHRAPETSETKIISVTTDIYQVGLTLFRLLNGIGSIRELKNRVGNAEFERLKISGKIPPSEDYKPFVANNIRRIINKATNPDASQRFQSALEMRRALEKIQIFGYWDTEPNGELFGVFGKNKFTLAVKKSSSGFIMDSFKENTASGRKTRVSKFCCSGLTETKLKELKKRYMLAVVNGDV